MCTLTGVPILTVNGSGQKDVGEDSNVALPPHTYITSDFVRREAGMSWGTWKPYVFNITTKPTDAKRPATRGTRRWRPRPSSSKEDWDKFWDAPLLSQNTDFAKKNSLFMLNTDMAKAISGELTVLRAHLEKWLGEEVEAYSELEPFDQPDKWKFRFYFRKSKKKAYVNIASYSKYGETLWQRQSELLIRVSKHLRLKVIKMEFAGFDQT
jgi:hypothetical protein